MSSMDDRQSSAPDGKRLISGAQRRPGLLSQMSRVEQMPFSDVAQTPAPPTGAFPLPVSPTYQNLAVPAQAATVTAPLQNDPAAGMPAVTRQLSNVSEVQTGALPVAFRTSTTTALRQPVVIQGSGKKSAGTLRPPRGRRWVVHLAVTAILALIVLGSVMSVIPVGSSDGTAAFNPFRPILNLVKSNNSNTAFIAAQEATATAVITHQDGYDPGQSTSTSLPPPETGNGSTLDRFAFGQCTYWANLRYHELTGYWVPWLGNAYQWAYGAQEAGWVVSATPHVPSIIVLQPYVQGASGYGHVAVVERINSDGSVYTSNYNWYANGGWDTLSYWTFYPGSGVSFVWHP
ncbi:MAG TPA: CHAP domain-containing protein [Ktedonobacteraceae bacterium]|nr:CHAP domain-containing protein [Ktedonobacteraceae bacterium]